MAGPGARGGAEAGVTQPSGAAGRGVAPGLWPPPGLLKRFRAECRRPAVDCAYLQQ